jgi:hypothetical protein
MASEWRRGTPLGVAEEKNLANELASRLACAFNAFFANEDALLDVDASERSITHKLAEYMQKEFQGKGLDVDCEYNRHGRNPKRLGDLHSGVVGADDQEAKTVFPDIVVHLRGSDKCNVLVIEVKKSTSSGDCSKDILKLKAFTKQLGEYRYQVGLFVLIDMEKKQISSIRCLINGVEEVDAHIAATLKELGYGE